MTHRLRRLVLVVLVLLVVAGAWAALTAYRVDQDLSAAVDDADGLRAAAQRGDDASTTRALASLKVHTRAAADRTSGSTWSALGHLPVVGDDARGIALASEVVADLADHGVEPLVGLSGSLDAIVTGDGRLDLAAIARLHSAVRTARASFRAAGSRLAEQDPSGFVDPVRTKYVDLAGQVVDAGHSLRTADTALSVLPSMLGKHGPRTYLLVFQNNAEIRSTGGIPGSWAVLRVHRGKASLTGQGVGGHYPRLDPPLPLSKAERALFGFQMGAYFVDADVTPDFPRAAGLLATRWAREEGPSPRLDGVISLDPVAMSYLLGGTGPVQVGRRTLTQENVVGELLNRPYLELAPEQQDVFFARAARAVFHAITRRPASPADLVSGMARAVRERRLLVAPFDRTVRRRLAGQPILGALRTGADAATAVDVTLDDGTGGKMSYYLRYGVTVRSLGCASGVQRLAGRMAISQTLPQAKAAKLPPYLTADGNFGIEPGAQADAVRLFAPDGGRIGEVRIDGKRVPLERVRLHGREVVTLAMVVTGPRPTDITWTMSTARGATGDVQVRVTPGVETGSRDSVAASSCR